MSDDINQKGWVAFFVLLVLESCIDWLGKTITLKFPYTGSAVSFPAVCKIQLKDFSCITIHAWPYWIDVQAKVSVLAAL